MSGEVRARLAGKKGDEFARTLDLFLKGQMVLPGEPMKAVAKKKKRKKVAPSVKFIVRDHFKKNSSVVKFYGFGPSFEKRFMGKIEERAVVELLKYHHDLQYGSLDADILADLGGKETAEVTLAGVFELLKLQPRGQSGTLFTDGYANIFYVRDAEGELRAVNVRWIGDGWFVNAPSVDDVRRWDPGDRVFSRNS